MSPTAVVHTIFCKHQASGVFADTCAYNHTRQMKRADSECWKSGLSLKHGFGGYGHGFGRCDRFDGLSGFGGLDFFKVWIVIIVIIGNLFLIYREVTVKISIQFIYVVVVVVVVGVGVAVAVAVVVVVLVIQYTWTTNITKKGLQVHKWALAMVNT